MMCWNPFQSLPRELTLAICDELDLNDLRHMRLTCKSLANDVAPRVLSHIIISANEVETVEELISELQSLTNPERAAVDCSSSITFGDLWTIFPDSDSDEGRVDIPSDDARRLGEELFTVLTSFKIVHTVNWFTGGDDPLWLQQAIWKAINKFPNLRHLGIHPVFLKQPLGDFDSLISLESISIFDEPFKHNGALFLSLSKLYASSSNLKSITIERQGELYDYQLSGYPSLQNLLSSSPKENPAHRLRRLALCNIPIHLDDISLSHLTHLTSFKLSSHLSDDGSLDYSPDDVWVAFRRSQIRLEELEVRFIAVADSLSDYLSSFSGLKKLMLSIAHPHNRASSESSAVKFWSEGFPNHVDTIQDFSVYACYDGQWCFGHHNRSLIEKCTKLKHLAVSLVPEDLSTKAENFNVTNTLIDTVVTYLPQVEQLEVLVPSREFQSSRRNSYRLVNWVTKYHPPTYCQSLPRLTVKSLRLGSVGVFFGVKDAQHGQLHYEPVL